jgi:hypothetical protein
VKSEIEVCVPCVSVGLGTLTATIRDGVSGELVRVEGVECVSLVNRVACLRLPVVAERDGLHRVAIHDGRLVWVAAISVVSGTAA